MKRLAEVTEAKQKAEEDAKKFREQLEREAEAKRLLMENNRKIESKYKEIESMVQMVRGNGIQHSSPNERVGNRGSQSQEALIEVYGENDLEPFHEHQNLINTSKNGGTQAQKGIQMSRDGRKSLPKPAILSPNQFQAQSRSPSPNLHKPSLIATAQFGNSEHTATPADANSWSAAAPRPTVPKPTDLLCPPSLPQAHHGPRRPSPPQPKPTNPSQSNKSPSQTPHPQNPVYPPRSPPQTPHQAALPTQTLPQSLVPDRQHQPHVKQTPSNNNSGPRERFLLPRRDGDSLERLEAKAQDLTPRDEALLSRGDYEQELAIRAKRAKERLEAAELRKMEERKQNMLGMFKDFREEVQNILSSYREVDPEKVESSQRDSIRKNLQSSMRRVEAEVHRAPLSQVIPQDSSEEEARHPHNFQHNNRQRAVKLAQIEPNESSEDSQDEEDIRTAKVLASQRERLAELREKKRKEIQAALGSTKGNRPKLMRHDQKSSSSSESEEVARLNPQTASSERAAIIQDQYSRLRAGKPHYNTQDSRSNTKNGQNQKLGRPQPRPYLETSGEDDDDLRYTNTKQSSQGMEGTFGLPSMGKPASAVVHTNQGTASQKPKIRLVSGTNHPSQTSKNLGKEDFAQAPSIGDRSLDELTEDQLLIVKEMIEQRIASSETRQIAKKGRKGPAYHQDTEAAPRDERPGRKVHTPAQDVTIDDDFYDENFISLVYELNTGAC